MRTLILLFFSLAAASCASSQRQDADKLMMFVGTYTEDSSSEGVYVYSFDQVTGKATLLGSTDANNPSFLSVLPEGKRLYAVSEYNDGRQGVYSFDIDGEPGDFGARIFQTTQQRMSTGELRKGSGGDPCNIYTDGKNVITANYSGGDISVFPLDEEGRVMPESQHIAFAGKAAGVVPHIHCVVPTPDGKYLLATDLGNDRIYSMRYRPGNKTVLDSLKTVYEGENGQGPRHLTFGRDGRFAYLINELGGTCTVMSYSGGKLTEVQRVMADEGGGRGSADIHVSPDGRFLYTSHRLKKDGISVFAIDEQTGKITKVSYHSTGVHPRNFAITPNGMFLLVACRDSNAIQIFIRDAATGKLSDTGRQILVGKPVCIVFQK